MRSSTETLQIAEATTFADIQGVAPLFDAYRVFYHQSSDLEASFQFLRDRWVARESVLFVAFEEGIPIGFVHLYPLFLSDKMRRFWLLNDLFVSEEARRRGVGRALMQRAERHARETGSAGLTLSTAVDNACAQALYEGEGYKKDSGFIYYNRFI